MDLWMQDLRPVILLLILTPELREIQKDSLRSRLKTKIRIVFPTFAFMITKNSVDYSPIMRKVAMNFNVDQTSSNLSKKFKEAKMRFNTEEISNADSQISPSSNLSRSNKKMNLKLDSLFNDCDSLTKEIDNHEQNSYLPSLKLIQIKKTRKPSTRSLNRRLSLVNSPANKDLADSNGNSLMSTINSSKDILANFSPLKKANRPSLPSSRVRKIRRISVGNQILFGSQASALQVPQNTPREVISEDSSQESVSQGKSLWSRFDWLLNLIKFLSVMKTRVQSWF